MHTLQLVVYKFTTACICFQVQYALLGRLIPQPKLLRSVIVTDNGSNIVPASCLQVEVDDDDNDDDDDDDGDDHEEFNESFSRIRNWINHCKKKVYSFDPFWLPQFHTLFHIIGQFH